jgi:acetolactate decarboxylase
MPDLDVVIPAFLDKALKEEMKRTGESASSIVTSALAEHFHTPMHTLFQVSTSGALVEGIYNAAVCPDVILKHGDFGLGTFENLDGEMVVLDGHIYRVRGDGTVTEVTGDACAPYAVVTRFKPSVDLMIEPAEALSVLTHLCDEHRRSNNIFYAVRLDGEFHHIHTRAVCPPPEGGRLIDAAKAQAEFQFSGIRGTLVGIWSPGFSSTFSISGYHFHFLSEDRQCGGHLLGCTTGQLRLRIEALTDFHLALPENESFLKADLSKTSAEELAYAEQAH